MTQPLRRAASLILSLALLAGAAGAAAAQDAAPPPRKDPTVARVLSGVGTFTPLVLQYHGSGSLPLVLGGIVLGPLPGYLYAGELRSGLTQAGIRAAILGAGFGGMVAICTPGRCDMWDDDGRWSAAVAVLVIGYFGSTALSVYDVHRVGRVTEAQNQRLASLSVQPTFSPQTGAAGFVVSWRH